MVDIANESSRSTTTDLPERTARHQAVVPDTTFTLTGPTDQTVRV